MTRLTATALAALLLPLGLGAAQAAEYPAGDPVMINGMEVAAVYLQPIEMEPAGMMKPAGLGIIMCGQGCVRADMHFWRSRHIMLVLI